MKELKVCDCDPPYDKVDTMAVYVAGALAYGHSYLYDANGNRVNDATYSIAGVTTTAWHVFDPNNVQLAYYASAASASGDGMKVTERYLYGSDRLGTLSGENITAGGVSTGLPVVYYEVHDHLGNVKMTFQATQHYTAGVNDYTTWSTSGVSNYYAFGSPEYVRTYSLPTYSWGFNGQLKVDDWVGKGDHYEYSDRGLNTQTGRWLTIDKLFRKYPSLSPYSFSADNPIFYVDRDGRKILIYYYNESGKNIAYEYGSKIKVPNNSFVQNTIASLDRDRIVKNNTEGVINKIENDPNRSLNIVESNNGAYNTSAEIPIKDIHGNLVPKGGVINPTDATVNNATIPFNPFAGLSNNNGTQAISPATTLIHEVGHVFSAFYQTTNYLRTLDTPDPLYENAQEKFATTFLENPVAKYYGEWLRSDHYSGKEITTPSPTSNRSTVTSESQLGQGQSTNIQGNFNN